MMLEFKRRRVIVIMPPVLSDSVGRGKMENRYSKRVLPFFENIVGKKELRFLFIQKEIGLIT